MKLKEFVKDSGGSTRDFAQIDPRLLQVRPGFNIRDLTTAAAREKLDVLKAQIKAEGVLEPLEIEFDGATPWINEGHRRHIAVMELIEEGEAFKTVPCIQERGNIKADKRTLHMLMRKKEDYEPLEYAKGIDRMVNVYGWDKAELAVNLGFKSKTSIDQYLEMLAMPEAVKQQVSTGVVSATRARQIVKDSKDDPAFAARLIAANMEENKRLGVGKKNNHKVTAKTIKRDTQKTKSKSEPVVGPTSNMREIFEAQMPVKTPERLEQERAIADGGLLITTGAPAQEEKWRATNAEEHIVTVEFASVATGETFALKGSPMPLPAHGAVQDLILALKPFAELANDHDLNVKDDSDLLEVFVRDVKRAWEVYARVVGDTQNEEAA